MKKRIFKKSLAVVISILMLLTSVPVFSVSAESISDTTADSFVNNITDGEVTITGYTDDATELDIPSNIDGHPVTSISDFAFYNCESLTSVTIPDSVTSIGEYAFCGCSNLASVTIPNSVTSIGQSTFSNCKSLTSVTIPDSVTSIGDYAFRECSNLASVTIPDSVTYIGVGAFSYCKNLTSIRIPDSVTSIGDFAFERCFRLTSVTIPNSITSINDWTFCFCENLYSVTIPDSVTSIDYGAFYNCTCLESVTIPDSVTSIGDDAFSKCISLIDVYYGSTRKQWYNVVVGSGNEYLRGATKHYSEEESEPTEPETTVPTETDPTEPDNLYKDDKTNIFVEYEDTDEAAAGAELVVEEFAEDAQIEEINFRLDGEKVSKLYDITLQKEGVEIQPDGAVIVKIPADNPDSKVYRVETDGTLTDMNAVYENGYMVFTTEHFSLYVVAVGSAAEEQGLLGDVNGDGVVNVKDATTIQKYVASLIELTDEALAVADFNDDANINVKDATAIQKHLAGIDTGYPIGE